jgi:hypothetical protein
MSFSHSINPITHYSILNRFSWYIHWFTYAVTLIPPYKSRQWSKYIFNKTVCHIYDLPLYLQLIASCRVLLRLSWCNWKASVTHSFDSEFRRLVTLHELKLDDLIDPELTNTTGLDAVMLSHLSVKSSQTSPTDIEKVLSLYFETLLHRLCSDSHLKPVSSNPSPSPLQWQHDSSNKSAFEFLLKSCPKLAWRYHDFILRIIQPQVRAVVSYSAFRLCAVDHKPTSVQINWVTNVSSFQVQPMKGPVPGSAEDNARNYVSEHQVLS